MPDASNPSPIAPTATSRLWTAGASGGVASAVLLAVAALHPHHAPVLLGGVVAVIVATWMVSRPKEASAAAASVATAPDAPAPAAADPGLLDAAFEALTDAVLVVSGGEPDDIAGRRVVLANRAARDLLRIQSDGAILVSVLRDPLVLEAVDEALFGGVERTVDWAGVRDRHWQAHARPLSCGEDRPLAVLVLRDDTDVRRMELMRVDFLANASHELRTPLASLSGFIETLKGHARDDPKARDRFLDIMSAQADRMGRLVADLLSLSRIELNEHIPPSGRVDLARAVTDVVDALSVLTEEKAVEVVVGGVPAASIRGDRDEIVQVIQNLIDNAVKYSPRGGRVEIEVMAGLTVDEAGAARMGASARLPLLTPDRDGASRHAAVVVRDHGPGMEREHLPRLTERFYRVEGQKSGGDRPGTGLGLAIVKHIVNRHRGGLSVESAPGQGTVFTAFFPLSDDRRPASERPPTL
ncbi:MAG: PAS domain-containing protein [Alphaproteobacteria bacterium]|nr:PAS domain-containing protein [Alphaproteobacteria bacterium]MBU1526259.1 PAS domain-containing protein [Alphaproteobacteria bacterium]MBU2116640.1 PAS domain-containing protein [Alphaproteobacteria bacterium]MBU2351416.1 PAS domain-containing protein [Alphaproteobacteria bacterium]MBU2382453.1 PAS domain-containing protein [Alphaproteobacteria bacterium]